eukprot:gene7378-9062_t
MPCCNSGDSQQPTFNDRKANNYMHLFKFIMVGNSDKRFSPNSEFTIGVEFGSRSVSIGDNQIKVQVWDTAGQEKFRSITRAYYRGAVCALIVYDITCRDSFESLSQWLSDCRKFSNGDVTITLIGNKCDLEANRQVSTSEAQAFASQNGLLFFETSAKTGQNVDAAFEQSAQKVLEKIGSQGTSSGGGDPTYLSDKQ